MSQTPASEGWAGKLSCFSPNYVAHDVSGEELRFYPISVGLAFKLRTIGKPLARSLAVLFGNKDQDHGTKDTEVTNTDGSKDRQVSIEPITEGLAKIRFEQRVEAIDGIITALTDEQNAAVVGEIIMDSLADVFKKSERKEWPPVMEFINTMPLPVLGGMLMGVIKANQEVFGPLAGKVTEAAESAVARIAEARVEEPAEETPSPTSG